ncbi:endonuclease/exonuclease/phosphatase family protein [Streptosporangium sp. NPDC002544]|uniref:endonuclease/exonuclease/phosphatase family protein n=1 Tax=Streptosporangium sp. NPDC002544 TaxID=3154538 RepID=UPI0033186470
MRRLFMVAAAVVTLGLTSGLVNVPAFAATDGTLNVISASVKAGEPISLTYSTPRPDPKNWIGLYTDPGNGPVAEKYVGPSLKWVYIPEGSGTATLPTDGLEPGDYVAYSLAKDGYAWLAQPVKLKIVSAEPLHFVSDRAPLRNARALKPYAATVGGLTRGDAEGLTFRKISGPRWVTVGSDGSISGTPRPPDALRPAAVRIEARNGAGETASVTAAIEVRVPGAKLVPDLKAMSWNLWHGGSQVKGAREKQLKFLLDHDVDVVGMQETSGTSAKELAEALGWEHFQAGNDLGIVSRYPITSRGPLPAASGLAGITARIRVDDQHRQDVVIWNVHLGYTPYGPYDACFGKMSHERLLANEVSSGRTPQITAVLAAMQSDLRDAKRTPVLLTGDFNAPSHLDWTPATRRCGYDSVAWPASVLPEKAGLKDSYRVAHPDPVAAPGITWSPIYPTFTGGYGHDAHKGEPEPQDRIDFVHYAGDLRVLDSSALVEGTPAPIPGHSGNAWTSDHAAVLTTFRMR